MDLRTIFRSALTVLVGALVVMFAVMVVVKVARERRTRRRDRLVRDVRPRVIESIQTGTALALPASRQHVVEHVSTSLLPKLRGDDRDELARLLAGLGVIDRARRRLRSRLASRRLRAAQLLGAAGIRQAVGELQVLLDDRDSDVRQAAVQALGRIGDPVAAPSLFAALDAGNVSAHAVSMAVLRIGQTASDDIVAALSDGSSARRTRVVAAELVGILGVYGARAELESLLDDEQEVADASIRSLGRLGFPQSADVLAERLSRQLDDRTTTGVTINAAIVRALQSIGDRSSLPVLQRAAEGPYRVAVAAREALAHLGSTDRRPATSRPVDVDSYSPIPALLPVPPMMSPLPSASPAGGGG